MNASDPPVVHIAAHTAHGGGTYPRRSETRLLVVPCSRAAAFVSVDGVRMAGFTSVQAAQDAADLWKRLWAACWEKDMRVVSGTLRVVS